MLNLRWSDIGEDSVRVEARRASRHRVSDDLDVQVFEWSPKTARSARTVPAPPETLTALLRLRLLSRGSPYVFLDCPRLKVLEKRFGEGPIPSSGQYLQGTRRFGAIQKKAAHGSAWPVGCLHDLRKSFGTRVAASGLPIKELSAHMGHSNIQITSEYYVGIEDSAGDRGGHHGPGGSGRRVRNLVCGP